MRPLKSMHFCLRNQNDIFWNRVTVTKIQIFCYLKQKERKISDQLLSICQIILKCYDMNVETLHLFVDLRLAYDTINREELWNIKAELISLISFKGC